MWLTHGWSVEGCFCAIRARKRTRDTACIPCDLGTHDQHTTAHGTRGDGVGCSSRRRAGFDPASGTLGRELGAAWGVGGRRGRVEAADGARRQRKGKPTSRRNGRGRFGKGKRGGRTGGGEGSGGGGGQRGRTVWERIEERGTRCREAPLSSCASQSSSSRPPPQPLFPAAPHPHLHLSAQPTLPRRVVRARFLPGSTRPRFSVPSPQHLTPDQPPQRARRKREAGSQSRKEGTHTHTLTHQWFSSVTTKSTEAGETSAHTPHTPSPDLDTEPGGTPRRMGGRHRGREGGKEDGGKDEEERDSSSCVPLPRPPSPSLRSFGREALRRIVVVHPAARWWFGGGCGGGCGQVEDRVRGHVPPLE